MVIAEVGLPDAYNLHNVDNVHNKIYNLLLIEKLKKSQSQQHNNLKNQCNRLNIICFKFQLNWWT